MTKLFQKYFAGIILFLIILGVSTVIEKIPYFHLNYQSATIFSPDSLPDSAEPASGYAWSDSVGWINFGDESSTSTGRVYVSNNELYGYAWGENIGWISMNCADSDSCSSAVYGVSQDSENSGVLTGYAWGENIGWIDFAPEGGGVTISKSACNTNTFSGYAWGENIGWIDFAPEGSGVSTTWVGTDTTGCEDDGGGHGGITYYTCIYEYSPWGSCNNNIQTRTIENQDHSNCENPSILTQPCEVIGISISPQTTTITSGESLELSAIITGTSTNNLANWSVIPIENIVSFYGEVNPSVGSTTIYSSQPNAQGIVNVTIQATALADITKKATSTIIIKPIKTTATTTPILCESYTYSSWTVCSNNNQNRSILTRNPPGCSAGIAPVTTQSCTSNFATSTPDTPAEIINDDNNNINNNINHGESGGNHNPKNYETLPISKIDNFLPDNLIVLGTTTEKIILGSKKIVESKIGSLVTKTITTTGVIGGGLAVSSIFAINGTTMADLLFLPFKLWGLLLSILGLKKRNRPWGTVYDSVTKQPIDPAYVTLKNLQNSQEITSITDLDGRYGFMVAPGQYLLTANKTNYIFPSIKMRGMTSDVLYNNLYFGENIEVNGSGSLISKNIPLDPIKFDWNEFIKNEKKLMKFYSRREKIIRIITDWIFRFGLIISIISLFLVAEPYNIIIFIFYIILTLLRKFGLKQKALGSLSEKDGTPLSFAVIRVMDSVLNVEVTNKVANKIGQYYCLVPKGSYYIKIEKKNDDESYTEVLQSPIIKADNGIINSNFSI